MSESAIRIKCCNYSKLLNIQKHPKNKVRNEEDILTFCSKCTKHHKTKCERVESELLKLTSFFSLSSASGK